MKNFLQKLKNPKVLIGILLFVIITILYFGVRDTEQTDFWARNLYFLLISTGLFIMYLVYLTVAYRVELKRSQSLKKSIKDQIESEKTRVRSDEQAKVNELQKNLDDGIAFLEKRLGKNFLYHLPWYIIIGPSRIGKSTALKNCGLDYPILGPTGRGFEGAPGTENIEWWFAEEAVILDTAGEYVAKEERHQEWLQFLEFLRKQRPRQPINGVLVAISVDELIKANKKEVEQKAQAIRVRLNELKEKFTIDFPVYLLFTKCDLQDGFVEYFNHLNRAMREQAWGCTLTPEQRDNHNAGRIFADEFEHLHCTLRAQLNQRFAKERNIENRRKIFQFPFQFASAKAHLTSFVDTLFRVSRYEGKPIFRGFYFTSGTQEGTPLNNIIREIRKDFGFPQEEASDFKPNREPTSYFLYDLFKNIIIPDKDRFLSFSGKIRRLKLVAAIAAVLLFAGFTWWSVDSYQQHIALLNDISTATAAAKNLTNGTDLNTVLIRLDDVRESLESWAVENGRENEVYERDVHFHFTKLRQAVLENVKEEIERALARTHHENTRAKEDYPYLLGAYKLMVNDETVPQKKEAIEQEFDDLDAAVFAVQQECAQHEFASMPAFSANFRFYLENLVDRRMDNFLLKDAKIVDRAQRYLMGEGTIQRFYKGVVDGANQVFPAIDETDFLSPKRIIEGSANVAGGYTYEAWKNHVEPQFNEISDRLEPSWIIGESQADITNLLRNEDSLKIRLREIYFEKYGEQWWAFLDNLSMRSFADLADVETGLEVLSHKSDSPIYQMFDAICRNTFLPEGEAGAADRVLSSKKVAQKTKRVTRLTGEPDKPRDSFASIADAFEPFHRIVGFDPDKQSDSAPLYTYFAQLKAIRTSAQNIMQGNADAKDYAGQVLGNPGSELQRAWQSVESMLENASFPTGQHKDRLTALLRQPIIHAWPPVLRAAERRINQLWETVVCEAYKTIENKYPFSEFGEDTDLKMLEAFFDEGKGKYWEFLKNDLKHFYDLQTRQEKTWQGEGVRFRREFFTSIGSAKRLADFVAATSSKIRFRIEPDKLPVPITRIEFSYGEEGFHYFNNPIQNRDELAFEWHKDSYQRASLVVRARINNAGRRKPVLDIERAELWSMFKLLDDMKKTNISSRVIRLEKLITEEQINKTISFTLRVLSGVNPFRDGFFSFTCPAEICVEGQQ